MMAKGYIKEAHLLNSIFQQLLKDHFGSDHVRVGPIKVGPFPFMGLWDNFK